MRYLFCVKIAINLLIIHVKRSVLRDFHLNLFQTWTINLVRTSQCHLKLWGVNDTVESDSAVSVMPWLWSANDTAKWCVIDTGESVWFVYIKNLREIFLNLFTYCTYTVIKICIPWDLGPVWIMKKQWWKFCEMAS